VNAATQPRSPNATSDTDDVSPRQLRKRLVTLVAFIAVLAAIASSDAAHAQMVRGVAAIGRVMAAHPVLGPVLFVVASALSAMLAFLSSALLVPSAVTLWGRAPTMALLWLGWMLGGLLAYSLARRFGPVLVRKLVSPKWLERFSARVSAEMPWGVVLLLQSALPSELPGYLLGLAGYPRARYLAALAIAELPFAIGVVLAGESVMARRTTVLVGLGLLAVLFSVVAFWLLQRHLRRSA